MSKWQKTKSAISSGGKACAVLAIIGVMFAHYGEDLQISPRAAEIIGNAEGCRREPYRCPANVLTVGIGSTDAGGEVIELGKSYTDEEIARRWKNDLVQAQYCVNQHANGRDMPQSVFDATVSFVFNVGCGTAGRSTLFRKARLNDWRGVCEELPKWVYAGGRKLKGLEARREKERKLCLSEL